MVSIHLSPPLPATTTTTIILTIMKIINKSSLLHHTYLAICWWAGKLQLGISFHLCLLKWYPLIEYNSLHSISTYYYVRSGAYSFKIWYFESLIGHNWPMRTTVQNRTNDTSCILYRKWIGEVTIQSHFSKERTSSHTEGSPSRRWCRNLSSVSTEYITLRWQTQTKNGRTGSSDNNR